MRKKWVRGLGATVVYAAALAVIAASGDDVAAATGWQMVALEVIAVSFVFGAFVGRFRATAVPPALMVGGVSFRRRRMCDTGEALTAAGALVLGVPSMPIGIVWGRAKSQTTPNGQSG